MKPTYEELEKRIKELEDSKKLKSSLLSGLSHDIRTPMNSIIGFTEILTDPNLSNEFRQKYIRYINKSGDVLMNLLDDIVDIVKIEAGEVTIQERVCWLNKILSELYTSVEECRRKSAKEKIKIRLIKPTKTESFPIYSDPLRLKQILSKLLKNALEHTDSGYIEFGCILQNSTTLKFFVNDTGVGISDKKLKTIFEQHQKQKYSESLDFGSAGLSLSISRSLVEMMGGKFWTESKIGIGAKFQFTLPYKSAGEQQDIKTPAVSKELDWSNKLILVAEDVQTNYMFIEAALHHTGVKLLWAEDGNQAIDLFEKNPDINLVLMDIQMPEMNGYEATQYIKSRNSKLPVIAQTAYALAGEKELILQAGCNDYISKPFKLNDLLTLLKKYL